ncbi:MAG: 3-phosphoshikimate 1-carboxyvinyltransferase [Solirubrobacterales bacterium]
MPTARFDPPGPLSGSVRPPPDKSISHRAAILAAMGEGETAVRGYLDAADTRSTLATVASLGAMVEKGPRGGLNSTIGGLELRIRGVGLRGAASAEIDVGNAGTLMRLLPGWLAGQPEGVWTLDGDESIRRRPIDRVVGPLTEMGAVVAAREGRVPPLEIRGGRLHGIEYRLPVASAQVKSCLLLAGLLADGPTTVVEPAPTRDHTERMLRAAGAVLQVKPAGTPVAIRGELPGNRITVLPAERLDLGDVTVPADFSSAAFLLVAAVLVPGSAVTVTGVGLNPTRIGLLGILNRMGAGIEVAEGMPAAGEPTGAVTARHGPPLKGVRVGGSEVPLAIDELPLVALLGCFAEGETHLSGAQELRHKESDRIATVVGGLAGLGAEIEATGDGFVVSGTGSLRGGALDSHGDHRLAMLGAVAGLASTEGVEVSGFEAAVVSYPGFEADLRGLAAA